VGRKIYLTQQSLSEMQVELDYLTKFCGPKIEKLLSNARSINNLGWGCIKHEQVLIKKRILELEAIIGHAVASAA